MKQSQNKFLLFLLAVVALILMAAVVFLLPDTTPPAEDLSRYSLEAPVFSHVTGVYEGPVTLTLSLAEGMEEKAEAGKTAIRYTLDGSLPTVDSPVYERPLVLEAGGDPLLMHIPTTSDELFPDWGYDKYQWAPPLGNEWVRHPVVRAAAFHENGESSPVAGHTYLIGQEAVPAASGVPGDPALAVVLLITDPEGFFSDETGIYVPGDIFREWREDNPEERVLGNAPANYNQRGRDWEREGHVTLLEPDGSIAFHQTIGLRIHGGFTRAWAQKTLRLYARAGYDQENWIEYPVFPGYPKTGEGTPMTRYKRLLLRNSGNDWSLTLFRDALMHRLVEDLGLDTQAVRPAVVYLNGEYWGIHHLRERLDEHYLEEHYGIHEEDGVLINERGWEVEVGNASDLEEYRQHMSRITGFALSEEERFELAETLMDMDHWMTYLSGHLYAANTDWVSNNMRVWRKRTLGFDPEAPPGHDGRWRWIFFDIDYAFDFLGYGYHTHDTVSWLAEESELFEKLSQSDTFRNRFAGRMADLLNTVFREDHVQAEADWFTRVLEGEMARNVERWPQFGDMAQWHREVQVIQDYAAQRPEFLRQHVAGYFRLPGSVTFAVSVPDSAEGHLRFNTLEPEMVERFKDRDGGFRGQVFQGIPLRLEALPAAGRQFSHWEGLPGQPTEPVVTFVPERSFIVRPVFRPQ